LKQYNSRRLRAFGEFLGLEIYETMFPMFFPSPVWPPIHSPIGICAPSFLMFKREQSTSGRVSGRATTISTALNRYRLSERRTDPQDGDLFTPHPLDGTPLLITFAAHLLSSLLSKQVVCRSTTLIPLLLRLTHDCSKLPLIFRFTHPLVGCFLSLLRPKRDKIVFFSFRTPPLPDLRSLGPFACWVGIVIPFSSSR